jgi:hypothetical protein
MPLLAGCGLPDSFNIMPVPPIQNLATSVSNNFEFSNPSHADDLSVSFKGFDLYYQFYVNSADININAYDPLGLDDPVTQLTSKGFRPVCRASDSPPYRVAPLIPVDTTVRLNNFLVEVFINYPSGTPSQKSTYTYTPPSTGVVVAAEARRDVKDSSTGYSKTFTQNAWYSNNYPDLDLSAQMFADCQTKNGGNAYLAMYVMSYGLGGGTTPIWSAAVYLGSLFVQIN